MSLNVKILFFSILMLLVVGGVDAMIAVV